MAELEILQETADSVVVEKKKSLSLRMREAVFATFRQTVSKW